MTSGISFNQLCEKFPECKMYPYRDDKEGREPEKVLLQCENPDGKFVGLYQAVINTGARWYFAAPHERVREELERANYEGVHIELHENYLSTMPRKPFLDIDIESGGAASRQLANNMAKKFVDFFRRFYDIPESVTIVYDEYDSSNDKKTSRHVIIRDFCWANGIESAYFGKKFAAELTEEERTTAYDGNPYRQNGSLRTVFSTKIGGDRTKRHLRCTGSLIWNVMCSFLTSIEIDCEQLEPIAEDICKRPDSKEFTGAQIEIVEKFAADNGLELGGPGPDGGIFLMSDAPVQCPVCNREHTGTSGNFGIIRTNGTSMYYICFRAGRDPNARRAVFLTEPQVLVPWTPASESRHEFHDIISTENIKDGTAAVLENVAVITNGGDTFYLTREIKDGELSYKMLTDAALSRNKKTWVVENIPDPDPKKSKKKKPTEVKIAHIVAANLAKMSYSYCDFMPAQIGPRGKIFNTFTGFRHQEMPTFDPVVIAPLVDHINEVWCLGQPAQFDYILNWLAHIVQFPEQKGDTAILIRSDKQGAGKSLIIDFLGSKVLGDKYYHQTGRFTTLLDKFNAPLENKLIVFADEIPPDVFSKPNMVEELKDVITRRRITVEHKGLDAYSVNDFVRYFAATNNDAPLPAMHNDRRFAVYNCSNKYADNKQYFADLAKKLDDNCAIHFYTMLKKRDISKFNPREIPESEAKTEMIRLTLSIAHRFIYELAEVTDGLEIISSNKLYRRFCDWCAENGTKPNYVVPHEHFGRTFNKFIKSAPGKINNRKENIYRFTGDELRTRVKEELKLDVQLLSEIPAEMLVADVADGTDALFS